MPKGLGPACRFIGILAPAFMLGAWSSDPVRAFPIISGASTGTQAPDTVYRADQIRPFLEAAAARRVDVAGIGDSNQLHFGTGFDHGFQLALGNRFGLYATEVFPTNPVGGYPTLGVAENPGGGVWPADASDPALPAAHRDYVLPYDLNSGGFPWSGGFLPAGQSAATHNPSLYVDPTPQFFTSAHTYQWHSTFYAFPGATGSITPQLRGNTGTYGYSTLATYPTITIPAGNATPVDVGFTIAPSTWTQGDGLWRMTLYDDDASYATPPPPTAAMHGPLFSMWQRLEDKDRATGVGYSTLLYQGGRCARDAALYLQSAKDTALAEWMRQATRLQNVPANQAMLMVQVEHGSNDRNQTALSVGPNPAPSYTGAGFRDNAQAIIDRLRQVWTANGYDPHNLFFTIGPYHPQPDFPQLTDYETASMALADSTYNVTVVRGTKMISVQTMQSQGYYRADGAVHLTQAGFEGMGRLGVNQLVSTLPYTGSTRSAVSALTFTFAADGQSYDPANLELDNLSTGMRIALADMSFAFDPTLGALTYTFPGLPGDVLPVGDYEARLGLLNPITSVVVLDDPPLVNGEFVYRFSALAGENSVTPEPAGATLIAAVTGAFMLRRRARRRPPGDPMCRT